MPVAHPPSPIAIARTPSVFHDGCSRPSTMRSIVLRKVAGAQGTMPSDLPWPRTITGQAMAYWPLSFATALAIASAGMPSPTPRRRAGPRRRARPGRRTPRASRARPGQPGACPSGARGNARNPRGRSSVRRGWWRSRSGRASHPPQVQGRPWTCRQNRSASEFGAARSSLRNEELANGVGGGGARAADLLPLAAIGGRCARPIHFTRAPTRWGESARTLEFPTGGRSSPFARLLHPLSRRLALDRQPS